MLTLTGALPLPLDLTCTSTIDSSAIDTKEVLQEGNTALRQTTHICLHLAVVKYCEHTRATQSNQQGYEGIKCRTGAAHQHEDVT